MFEGRCSKSEASRSTSTDVHFCACFLSSGVRRILQMLSKSMVAYATARAMRRLQNNSVSATFLVRVASRHQSRSHRARSQALQTENNIFSRMCFYPRCWIRIPTNYLLTHLTPSLVYRKDYLRASPPAAGPLSTGSW